MNADRITCGTAHGLALSQIALDSPDVYSTIGLHECDGLDAETLRQAALTAGWTAGRALRALAQRDPAQVASFRRKVAEYRDAGWSTR